MAHTYDAIDDDLAAWLGEQPMFFVATAPSSGGHVNLSPKGHDTFRIVDPTTVAYLDLTGSGVETISHLRDDGRITFMFCAFEGRPRIVRLQGTGEVFVAGDPGWDDARAPFADLPGARAVVRARLDRVSDSCGFSVPLMAYQGERDTLLRWAGRKSDDELAAYRGAEKRHLDRRPGRSARPDHGGVVPALTDDELAAFLAEPGHPVRIATVDGDGAPRVVPAWFMHRGGRIWFTPRERSAWLDDLRRDPRVALTIDEDPLPYRKVAIRGTAELAYDLGADDEWRDLYHDLSARYVGDEGATAYLRDTWDEPRALLAVSMAEAEVRTWRMPVGDEDRKGIWAGRYWH